MFDLLSKNDASDDNDDTEEDITEDDVQEALEECTKEEQKQISPFYSKYLDMQNKYPGCIVAYRLGDFYEVFGENAVKISNELDLTLTGRDVGLKERVPVVGFPYHVSDLYFQKLVSKGFKLAIVEQMSEYILKKDEKIDVNTGEILNQNPTLEILTSLFGNTMEIKL